LTVDSPENYAKKVCQKLTDISSDHDGSKVDIISHSMGGLDSRWCIEKRGGDFFVDDLITVATPHQGTIVAYLGTITPGGRDMVPGSDFLTDLNSGALSSNVEYTSVWGGLDEAVTPNENAELPPHMTWNAETRSFKAGLYTHLAMVALKDVYNQYYPYLED
jgi:triacylglycerol lipase